MGKSLVLGTILGAVVLFVWMMVSWMVLPWHCTSIKSFADESKVATVLMENTTEDGVYVLPCMCCGTDTDSHMAAMKKGPVVFTAIQRYGFDVDSAGPYITSFIIQLIGAFLVTLLLLHTQVNYWKGVLFVTLVGLTVGVLGVLPNWNWWGFSAAFVGIGILDLVIGWFFAGLVVSAVAKRV